jgi:hypothetical protein
MPNISNYDNLIDSRDVSRRVEELEAEREALAEQITDLQAGEEVQEVVAEAERELAEWDEDNKEELDALKALAEEVGTDVTLIRDSYFEDYARELAEEIGAIYIGVAHGWPLTCIDWEQAAKELRMDYSSVEYGDVTYLYRE